MIRYISILMIAAACFTFSSCGNSDKLNIKGDPEAILLAENMVKAFGGRKAWSKIRSVYIRTLNAVVVSDKTYMLEEWINLDEPKFIDRTRTNDEAVTNMVNHNDGWKIKGKQIEMLSPNSITRYLNWYDQFILVNLRKLAIGSENIEVKINGPNRFDMYISGDLKCSFELDDSFLLKKYYSLLSNKKLTILEIKDYNEYEGYKFPLKLSEEGSMSIYQTDYFDPSPLSADKAFPISFNPREIAEAQ